jgi:phospholipid/cholesterol/gamma-HCH transport system permease protein
LLAHIGGVARLSNQAFRAFFRRPFELRPLIRQLAHAGIGSISITFLTAIFTGMVLALQFATGLEAYGGSLYTGKLVALGIVRELGPVLTALLVGGRVGAGITAELGSMNVTEQIDAIRALGADPVKKLVAPRVIACIIALPLLTIVADIVGVLGGMLVTMREVGVTARYYYAQTLDSLYVADMLHGLAKSLFFGYFIAIIGCYIGMQVRGGTEGVGRSTTTAVVSISIVILVSNYLLTNLFVSLYG